MALEDPPRDMEAHMHKKKEMVDVRWDRPVFGLGSLEKDIKIFETLPSELRPANLTFAVFRCFLFYFY